MVGQAGVYLAVATGWLCSALTGTVTIAICTHIILSICVPMRKRSVKTSRWQNGSRSWRAQRREPAPDRCRFSPLVNREPIPRALPRRAGAFSQGIGYSRTMKRPPSLRPKVSGKYISYAVVGMSKNSPGTLARIR